jgi:stage III sporulation protein AH
MKLHMIIRKKQIILTSLVMILAIAIYLNWQFSQGGDGLSVSDTLDSVKNYGEAQLVSATANYFSEATVNRQKARDQAIESLSKLLKDSKLSAKEKTDATNKAFELSKMIETEGKMENLIKAKGFPEAIVYIDDQKANIVVKTNGLLPTQAAQIKDIVMNHGKIKAENISIVEVK